MKYPKTLIISDSPFCLDTGFGVTLTTFFQGWPKDNLFQFYRADGIKLDKSVCERMVWADVPGHWGRRHAIPFFLGLRPAWREKYSLYWLKKNLRKWRPEVVYSISFSMSNIAYADWIAQTLNCPHIAHIADDGIRGENVYNDVKAILERAKVCIAISEEMKEEYKNRYGIDFEVLHNGAAEELFLPPKTHEYSEDILIVRYVGSIVRGHHFEAIEDVIEAVKMFNQAGNHVRFEIYGGEWTKDAILPLVNNDEIRYNGFVSEEEGRELLKTADLLVIPITFSKQQFSFVRLSLPTKFSEYLASGSPTLVYGPSGVAPIEYCKRHSIGLTQTNRSVPELVNFLTKLKGDKASFRNRALQDRAFAKEHLSATVMRNRFHQIIEKGLGE